jgi:hypothetical protein
MSENTFSNHLNKLKDKSSSLFNRLKSEDIDYFFEQFMYGHREILLSYAKKDIPGINPSSLLIGGLAHGWAPDEQSWKVRKRNLRIAPRYMWNVRSESILNNKLLNIAIGAPWIYLLNLLELKPGFKVRHVGKNSERPNLLMLTHNVLSTNKDIERQARFYDELCDGKTTTVCLFWLDFCNRKIYQAFEKRGFRIECAGYPKTFDGTYQQHPGRVEFLPNLLEIMSKHENYFTDECTTSLFYAATLGLKIEIRPDLVALDFQNDWKLRYGGDNKKFFNSGHDWMMNYYPETLLGSASLSAINSMGWSELGFDSILSPLGVADLAWKNDDRIEPTNVKLLLTRIEKLRNDLEVELI